jgi:hypothetical protein
MHVRSIVPISAVVFILAPIVHVTTPARSHAAARNVAVEEGCSWIYMCGAGTAHIASGGRESCEADAHRLHGL